MTILMTIAGAIIGCMVLMIVEALAARKVEFNGASYLLIAIAFGIVFYFIAR